MPNIERTNLSLLPPLFRIHEKSLPLQKFVDYLKVFATLISPMKVFFVVLHHSAEKDENHSLNSWDSRCETEDHLLLINFRMRKIYQTIFHHHPENMKHLFLRGANDA